MSTSTIRDGAAPSAAAPMTGADFLLDRLPAAVYTCDSEGRITRFNEAAVELWGRRPQCGHDVWCGSYRIFDIDGNPVALDACPMSVALREGRPIRGAEIVVERPDGTRRNVLANPEPLFDASGAVVGAINTLIDVTEQRLARAELAVAKDDLARQVDALTKLHDLGVHLATMTELRPCLLAILQTLIELHAADRGVLSLHDSSDNSLRATVSIGFSHETERLLSRFEASDAGGACGRAFASRQRVIIEDASTDPHLDCFRDLVAREGFRAVHATPILTRGGEILGVLTVHFDAPRIPTPRETQLADMCARMAADKIEHERADRAVRAGERRFRDFTDTAPARTPPRPPTAPRTSSSPSSATSCARRSRPCWRWCGWRWSEPGLPAERARGRRDDPPQRRAGGAADRRPARPQPHHRGKLVLRPQPLDVTRCVRHAAACAARDAREAPSACASTSTAAVGTTSPPTRRGSSRSSGTC
jgi:hypothetical protein